MTKLAYKQRIHKAKLSGRSFRYILADQLARAFPPLQRRWQFPVEAIPIAPAAAQQASFETAAVDGPRSQALATLFPKRQLPAQIVQTIYTLQDVVVTGQAGAMIKDGLLLAVRERPNWVSSLRPRSHRLRKLEKSRIYYNLISPLPARGHIFHWLFDFVVPLLTWLEHQENPGRRTLLVNAERLKFQKATLDFLLQHYSGLSLEPVAAHEAVLVPALEANIFTPYEPRALQAKAGLDRIDALGAFLARDAADWPSPERFYISRDDARRRRVANETAVMDVLAPHGFEKVVLGGMPIARQVGLFARAGMIISPHGAGLAHLAWCRPGTRVFEIFPSPHGPRGRPKNATDNFWLISQLRGLDYEAAFAGPPLDRQDKFEIPIPLVEEILTSFGCA